MASQRRRSVNAPIPTSYPFKESLNLHNGFSRSEYHCLAWKCYQYNHKDSDHGANTPGTENAPSPELIAQASQQQQEREKEEEEEEEDLLLTLPNDLKFCIFELLDKDTIKQLRLCCRWLAYGLKRYIFGTIRFSPHRGGFEKVINVADNTMLACYLKKLTLKTNCDITYMKFRQWRKSIHMGGASASSLDQSEQEPLVVC